MIKKIIIISISLILIVTLCLINAKGINTSQVKPRQEIIQTEKIQDNASILVAYFSDLHFKNYIDENYLDNIIDTINNYAPDIVLFGGDLIETSINNNDINYLKNSLKKIDAKYGKYAVYGEYDFQNNHTKEKVLDIYNNSNFRILNNENLSLNINDNQINIVGLNSLEINAQEAFNNIDTNNYTFVLCHYPDNFTNIINYNFDYCLAGHSHGNQVYIPIFNLFNLKEGSKEYNRGKKQINNKTLDITNGVGRINMNARFLADAEVCFYRLEANTK